jgi:hypothetical protein
MGPGKQHCISRQLKKAFKKRTCLGANEPVKRLQLGLLRAVYVFDRGADLMGAGR